MSSGVQDSDPGGSRRQPGHHRRHHTDGEEGTQKQKSFPTWLSFIPRVLSHINLMCFCVQAMEECKTEPFENHSALEIAEQLTMLDHLVFKVISYEWVTEVQGGVTDESFTLITPGAWYVFIPEMFLFFCREFFGQGWMKNDKNERTPYIMKTTKHFNDVGVSWGLRWTDPWMSWNNLFPFCFLLRSVTGSPRRSSTGTTWTRGWRWWRSGWRWRTSVAASTTTTPCWRSRPRSTAAPSSASRGPGSKFPSRYESFTL